MPAPSGIGQFIIGVSPIEGSVNTWVDMIGLVLRDCGAFGVGQTPQEQDVFDCIRRMNMLLHQWKTRRWLVYHLVESSVVCDGSLYYTVGAGEDFSIPRPDMINAAFARQINPAAQPNQPDFPLRLIHSYEEYSQITLKRLSAGPSWALFYDSGFPVGKLYPWPLMNSQYELHIIVKAELTQVSLNEDIALPPEYEYAIYTNLMMMTRSAYRLPPDPYISGQAKASLETIRAANFQIPTLNLPAAVRGVGGYNIWSDSWGPNSR